MKGKLSLSRVQLLATAWTTAYQAPLSMGFSRQEYWSGVPLPSPAIKIMSNKHHESPPWPQFNLSALPRIINALMHSFRSFSMPLHIWKHGEIYNFEKVKKKNKIRQAIILQLFCFHLKTFQGFPHGPVVTNLPANARDTSSIPGPGWFHVPRSN